MDKTILVTAVSYAFILAISIAVPLWVYIKWRQSIVFAIFFSLILNVLIVNLYFQVSVHFGLIIHSFFAEAHEVSWVLSAILTAACCKIAERIRKPLKKF